MWNGGPADETVSSLYDLETKEQMFTFSWTGIPLSFPLFSKVLISDYWACGIVLHLAVRLARNVVSANLHIVGPCHPWRCEGTHNRSI